MADGDLPRRSWAKKFADAFRGVKHGVRGQSSFYVHIVFAAAVVLCGIALGVQRIECVCCCFA